MSPLALEFAQKHNIDLAKVTPTGEGRRITYFDIKSFMEPKTFSYYNDIKSNTKRVRLDLKKHLNPDASVAQGGAGQTQAPAETHVETAQAQAQTQAHHDPEPEPMIAPGEPEVSSQPLPAVGSTIPAHIRNPKSEIPHFWLKKRLDIDPLDTFLQDLPTEKKVTLDSALIKIAKDAILANPEFFNFRVKGRFLRANHLWIYYKNLADPTLNRTVRLDDFNRLSYDGSEDFDPDKPKFKIIDATGTDISALMPVLRENQVP